MQSKNYIGVFLFVLFCSFAEGTDEQLKHDHFWNKNLRRTARDESLSLVEKNCIDDVSSSDSSVCQQWEWSDKVRLTMRKRPGTNAADITCVDVLWEAADCSIDVLEDCIDMSTAHWYGGTIIRRLRWPIEKWTFRYSPYVTQDSYPIAPEEFGSVQERYWVSSNGTAYYVDWEVPLWVSVNSGDSQQLCFKAQYTNSPYNNHDNALLSLNYTVCQGDHVRHVHDYMAQTYWKKPIDIPDERLFKYPIWSTWAQYKENVTQEKVLEFADDINNNGFENAQMEVDDRWEVFYGDMEFDLTKFPDPKGMVDALAQKGFRTTLWVHPFVNLQSPSINTGMTRVAFVTDPGRILPALTRWWVGGTAMTIDFTESRGTNWFNTRLRALQTNYNISSFKFDAGETNWLPNCFRLSEISRNPNIYSQRYAEVAYALDRDVRCQEVRVGAGTQHLPVFVRMMDKDSRWGFDNGIETLIPHTLNFGIIGYPFVLPDMVGGNAYGSLPDRELFIRWIELNVFLPSVQFSITPWQFDSEVLEISRNMSALHERYAQTFIDLGKESMVTGAPIVRPLWWVAPLDSDAQTIDTEFLVGNDLLVAPVVIQGARSRDIYLPEGQWHDELRGNTLAGGVWLRDYVVQLNELAYFTRV